MINDLPASTWRDWLAAGAEYAGLLAASIVGGAILAAVAFGGKLSIPNPSFTPGAVRTTSAADACARPMPPRPGGSEWRLLKQEAMREYGLPWSTRGNYELDHDIPRCLGGADSLANLWPEKWDEARWKDKAEIAMCKEVCDHPTDERLREAQQWFRTNSWAK